MHVYIHGFHFTTAYLVTGDPLMCVYKLLYKKKLYLQKNSSCMKSSTEENPKIREPRSKNTLHRELFEKLLVSTTTLKQND